MSLEYSLPIGKKEGIKNLIFTILSHEYPLKLIELTNLIRKRYGKAVTFQAVRKAVIELQNESIISKTSNFEFELNKEWVFNAKKSIDELYSRLAEGKESKKNFDSLGGEITVFTFDSVGSMMKFWEDLIDDWVKKIDLWEPNQNCYQAAHVWEVLMYPESERKIMSHLIKKGIKSYTVITGKTPLDKMVAKFYKDLGIKVAFAPSSSTFDKEYAVGTYGELVAQTRYPKEIVDALDEFFKKTKDLSNFDLKKLSEIIHIKCEIKLTVNKNVNMAKQINSSIISQFD
jgi:hypothetical protein